MSEQQLKPGDRVKFNLGREDGPVYYGTVTNSVMRGRLIIRPDKKEAIGPRVEFFNITKID